MRNPGEKELTEKDLSLSAPGARQFHVADIAKCFQLLSASTFFRAAGEVVCIDRIITAKMPDKPLAGWSLHIRNKGGLVHVNRCCRRI
jgi:hypothetical protein